MMISPLDIARRSSLVSSEDLAVHLYGGYGRLRRLKAIWKRVEEDPALSKVNRNSMNHEERYVDACRKIHFFKLICEEVKRETCKESLCLDEIYDLYLSVDENLPLDVHLSMFIPLMMYHTSAEQRDRWLKDALNFNIIGAYAQTELAHGSNVRGIETVAVFDETTQMFDLHSPTLTSLKWWPGGLGHTATHAVVYANLLIKGSNKGVHAFVVPLRDLRNHKPLEGIEVGDIGPKLGYNSMDNGYARFTHVKVPRDDMLAGYAQVGDDGSYTKQAGAEKVAYGIMLDVRCRIVSNSAYVLARALTIAIRYSFVRRQGGAPQEKAVIEYPSQRRILVPLLALAYALHFTGIAMRSLYDQYVQGAYCGSGPNKQREEVIKALLPRLHMQSAGLKALVTALVSEGMERCRKACGGHGFLSNSGFADLMTSYLPFCTLEGTREVLGQQTGRALLKMRTAGVPLWDTTGVREGMDVRSLLRLVSARGLITPAQMSAYTALLKCRVDLCLDRAEAAMQSHSAQQNSIASNISAVLSDVARKRQVNDALTAAGVELVAASESYCDMLIVANFAEGIANLMQNSNESAAPRLGYATLKALQRLWFLLLVQKIEEHAGDFSACGALPDAQDANLIHTAVGILCGDLQGDLVNLVEAWQISDTRLDSTIGRSDGRYAEALYQAAREEPLNRTKVSAGYDYLRNVIKTSGFAASKL